MEPKNAINDYGNMTMKTINNILPFDGIAEYFPNAIIKNQADTLFHSLLNTIQWENDIVSMFGKTHVMSRKSAWYGEKGCTYIYGSVIHNPLPWTSDLVQCKQLAESIAGKSFNSCLCNLYHSGMEGMGWHSDDEKELGINPDIISLSFGADRIFRFQHNKTKECIDILLAHGSILHMHGECQHHWKHALPKSRKIVDARINLTFRNIHSL